MLTGLGSSHEQSPASAMPTARYVKSGAEQPDVGGCSEVLALRRTPVSHRAQQSHSEGWDLADVDAHASTLQEGRPNCDLNASRLTHICWHSARGCCWSRPRPVIQEAPHQVWRGCCCCGRGRAAAGWRQRVAPNQLQHAAGTLLDRALGRLLCLADRLRVGLHARR